MKILTISSIEQRVHNKLIFFYFLSFEFVVEHGKGNKEARLHQ